MRRVDCTPSRCSAAGAGTARPHRSDGSAARRTRPVKQLVRPLVDALHRGDQQTGELPGDPSRAGGLLDVAQGVAHRVRQRVLYRNQRIGGGDERVVAAPCRLVSRHCVVEGDDARHGSPRVVAPLGELFGCLCQSAERAGHRTVAHDSLCPQGDHRKRAELHRVEELLDLFDEQCRGEGASSYLAVGDGSAGVVEHGDRVVLQRAEICAGTRPHLHGAHATDGEAEEVHRRGTNPGQVVDQCGQFTIVHRSSVLHAAAADPYTASVPAPPPIAELPRADVLADLLHDELPPAAAPGSGTGFAAVLVLLHDVDGVPHVVLTRRADHLSHHPGQVSLPGGRYEPSDAGLANTALRETWEEIGVPVEAVRLVRQLGQVHTQVSGFLVTPFVGVATEPIVPVIADGEIARIMQVPVADILTAHALLPEHPTIATLRYALDGEDVWGATARILVMFVAALEEALGSSR